MLELAGGGLEDEVGRGSPARVTGGACHASVSAEAIPITLFVFAAVPGLWTCAGSDAGLSELDYLGFQAAAALELL
jgi:hypothetical protein